MSNNRIPKTVVEFTDVMPDPGSARLHKTREIRINGVPVLVMEDGIDIEHQNGEVTKVHITLLPTEIHFQAATPYPDEGDA